MDCFDQTGKTRLVSLVANMPFGGPQQLRMAENPGAASHPREPEIGRVGQHRGHQRNTVFGRRAGTQMSEPVGKPDPAVNLGEQLSDAQARQHAIEPPRDLLGAIGVVSAHRTDREACFGDNGFGQLARHCHVRHLPEPGFECGDTLGLPFRESVRHRQPQPAFLTPRREHGTRQ